MMRQGQWGVRWMAATVVVAVALGMVSVVHAAPTDEAMRELAQRRGCTQCHSIDAKASPLDDDLPVGPSWQEVASKYQARPGAQKRLVQAVRQGSDPQRAHWRGRVAGKAMPPNAPRVSEEEARQLVRWILAL